MNPTARTLERVATALAELPHEAVESKEGTPSFAVERGELHAVLERLRDAAGFETLTFITAIDRMGGRSPEPRYEVVWQLHSIEHVDRVRVRTRVTSEDATVPTCTDLWSGAAFMERECYDMFGIRFEGNPNLARLLMPEGYGHHPLRKDFPHQGIEPDRIYREWDRERRKEWERDLAEEGPDVAPSARGGGR